MRLLVVEDEKKVASFIKKGLEEEHYAVDLAYDGNEGLYLAENNEYDLVILDVMLPKKSGIEVLKSLRAGNMATPIMMLTAKDSVSDRVTGLDSGCDDYLTKPFAFDELLARIRALLRRGTKEKVAQLKVADLVIDLPSHKVTRAGKDIDLTSKEYSLLTYFVRNKDRILTRTNISEHVWDYNFDSFTNVIDVYVNYLRNKIDKDFEKKLIHTVRGVGYTLKE
jgi:heavy metal response regulator